MLTADLPLGISILHLNKGKKRGAQNDDLQPIRNTEFLLGHTELLKIIFFFQILIEIRHVRDRE